MARFQKDEQVCDEFLGMGRAVDPEPVRGLPLVQVRFDIPPPRDYNCGQNPCCRFESTLTRLTEGG